MKLTCVSLTALIAIGCGGQAKSSSSTATSEARTTDNSPVAVSGETARPWWFRNIVAPNDRFVVAGQHLSLQAYDARDITQAGHGIARDANVKFANVRCELDGNIGRVSCENATLEKKSTEALEARFEQCKVETQRAELSPKQLRDLEKEVIWQQPVAPASLEPDLFVVAELITTTRNRVSRNDCSGHFESCRAGERCHPCDPAGPPWVIDEFQEHRHARVWAMFNGRPAGAPLVSQAVHHSLGVPLIVFGTRQAGWFEPASVFRSMSLNNMNKEASEQALKALDTYSPKDAESKFVTALNAFAVAAAAGRKDIKPRAATALGMLEQIDWNAAHFEFRIHVLPLAPRLLEVLRKYANGEVTAHDPCGG